MSWTYHPELLATPVPRYTSYPTAAEFHAGVGAADMATSLASVPKDADVSLYVHIPYCQDICWYCGCNTAASNRKQRLSAYLEALHTEIALVAKRLDGCGRVRRIAFGGGSPNAISAEDFLRLVARLAAGFDCRDAVLSVELDPRTLDGAWIDAMAAAGVQRASLGVQSFAPHVQEAIGRVQPLALVGRAVADLRSAGVSSINFDLMYGLPRQAMGDLAETLREACALAPERIALFGYAHVPHLIPRQRRIDDAAIPPSEERFAQARFGHEFLTRTGYQPVGFDHFALPHDPLAAAARTGSLRRNFQGFTDDSSEILIGLGASAISQFPRLLVQNEKNAGRYRMLVSAGQLPAVRGIARPAGERMRARIIESLLCQGAADAGAFATSELRERLRPFEQAGLIGWQGTNLRIENDGRPYARSVASAFDAHRAPSGRQFSSAI